ncbi:thioesterase II family protein [Saccharopolyspora rosea]|uniref:Thioesterase II family protein n=1 Tax=Saccharopolyspora rosea TaxID=524884 RepID=A0ABW3FQW4_9PSEU|nr:alpha/beta fold hydrolase [Saccharopolyspora rosea]
MTPSPTKNPWIRRFGPRPDGGPHVVCFPHAGGSASYFSRLARRLAPDVATLSVQYPGRQERRREPVPTSIDELADDIAEALAPLLAERHVFFGHSMGSVVAFEVARRLEVTGTGPLRLFASARRAPSTPDTRKVHLLDDAGLLGEMSRLGGTAQTVLADPEMAAMILPAVRADYRAIGNYSCPRGAAVRCPITVVVGDRDPVVTAEQASSWQEHTTSGFDLTVHPGGHFYLDDNLDAVARDITAALAG